MRDSFRGLAIGMNLIQILKIRINWRASLVPAAAVIPAPIAYIKVVVVKKLVVGSWTVGGGEVNSRTAPLARLTFGGNRTVLLTECRTSAPPGLL